MENYKQKITPRRYVYHITKKDNRCSIMKDGLVGNSSQTIGYSNAIFAHNNCQQQDFWYPYVLDSWEIRNFGKTILDDYNILGYDVWRIDTKKISNSWYIDNVAQNDFLFENSYALYIVTFENIVPSAMRLVDLNNPLKIFCKNGVTHIVNEFK